MGDPAFPIKKRNIHIEKWWMQNAFSVNVNIFCWKSCNIELIVLIALK